MNQAMIQGLAGAGGVWHRPVRASMSADARDAAADGAVPDADRQRGRQRPGRAAAIESQYWRLA
jgi:hypothetical protein